MSKTDWLAIILIIAIFLAVAGVMIYSGIQNNRAEELCREQGYWGGKMWTIPEYHCFTKPEGFPSGGER